MDPRELLEPMNLNMATVREAAAGQLMKKMKRSQQRKVMEVKVAQICDNLNTVMHEPISRIAGRTFHRTSMVASGVLRIHGMQADILLDDTKKLLDRKATEKAAMKSFDKNLDAIPPNNTLLQGIDLDRLTTVAFTEYFGHPDASEIDWTLGPPRALPEEITMIDEDGAAPSTELTTALERARDGGGSFEGSILSDWDVGLFGPMIQPEHVEEGMQDPIIEEPVNLLAEGEAAQRPVPEIVMTTGSPAQPAEQEESQPTLPAATSSAMPQASPARLHASPQPPQEQPPQMMLSSLDEDDVSIRAGRKGQKKVPFTDPVIFLQSDVMKAHVADYSDTMRCNTVVEDIIKVPKEGCLAKADGRILAPKPLHRKIMAAILQRLFQPGATVASFPGPEVPLHLAYEEFLDTSRMEERTEVAMPSLIGDVTGESSSYSHSKISFLEMPTAPLDVSHRPMQAIEECEVSATSPAPAAPSTKAGESSATKAKRSGKENGKEAKASKASATRDSKDAKPTDTPGVEQEPGVAPGIEQGPAAAPLVDHEVFAEETDESLSSHGSRIDDQTIIDYSLDYLSHKAQVMFDDLLPDADEEDAARLFRILLRMHHEGQLYMVQDSWCGPITVRRAAPAQEAHH